MTTPKLERLDLTLFNDNIIYFQYSNVGLGDNINSPRIRIFYGGNIFIVVEDKLKMAFLSSVCKFFGLTNDDPSSSISSVFGIVVRAISPPSTRASSPKTIIKNIVNREKDPPRLFGMDNLSQLNMNATVFDPNINILSLSLPEVKSLANNEYEVYLFLSGMILYIRTLVINSFYHNVPVSYDYADSQYFFRKQNLLIGKLDNEIYQSAITNKPLNLILITQYHYRFKDYIMTNNNLDGWITRTITGYQIWLKDINSCSDFQGIDLNTIDNNSNQDDYYFQEDIDSIINFKVVSWYTTINLI